MNTLSCRRCSKTGLAIGLYLMAMVSLVFLAHSQIDAMYLIQSGRPSGVFP